MKTKTIRRVLMNKINEWSTSIEDEEVAALVRKNTIVTGGSIASMLLREDVNDYDVYFKNKKTVLAVMKYYRDKYKIPMEILDADHLGKKDWEGSYLSGYMEDNTPEEALHWSNAYGIACRNLQDTPGRVRFWSVNDSWLNKDDDEVKAGGYVPVFISPNAISLTDDLQIVLRFYGSAEEVHKNYDFVHALNWYDHKERKVHLVPEAMECLLTKELRYQGSLYPLTSIIRTKKFIKRGFTCSAGEYLKMCYQVSQLDLSNPRVLAEQLIGVDIAYFNTLLKALEGKFKDDEFNLTYAYLNELITRIFNDDPTEE